MIIITVPKPFRGEFDIIQQNAIDSWLAIKPTPHIYLLGDEEGTAEIARQKKVTHIPSLERNGYGTPLLDGIFTIGNGMKESEVCMYINTDIVLMDSPLPTIELIRRREKKFLAVGRRYELKVPTRMKREQIKSLIQAATPKQKSNSWMDYFIFTRGVFGQVPPFALGRTFWDKWLVWSAKNRKIPVFDITSELYAVHQTHSYVLNNKSKDTVWAGREALENLNLAGGWSHGATVADASFRVENGRFYKGKNNEGSLTRLLLDLLPFLWPTMLKIRLMREKFS